MSTSRGLFIVFEGLDRSGKTLQAHKLVEFLSKSGAGVASMRFPDRTTPIGQMCSEYLTGAKDLGDELIHLLFTANRWEKQPDLKKELEAGNMVVCDRYSYSGVAYSYAKAFTGTSKLSPVWQPEVITAPEMGLISPDLVIFCNVTPSVAMSRGGYGQERYENMEFQQLIKERYMELKNKAIAAEQNQIPAPKWVDLSCDGSIEDVHEQIKAIVLDFQREYNQNDPEERKQVPPEHTQKELLYFTQDNFGFL